MAVLLVMVERVNRASTSAVQGIRRGIDQVRSGAEQVQRATTRWRDQDDVRISQRARALNRAKEAAANDRRVEEQRSEDARRTELRQREDSVARGMVEQRLGRYQTMANIEAHRAADAMDREALEVARKRKAQRQDD